MTQAHFPPFDTADWLTPGAAVSQYGIPYPMIQGAILSGDLSVRSAAGQTLVRHDEIKAMRLRLMGRCSGCED